MDTSILIAVIAFLVLSLILVILFFKQLKSIFCLILNSAFGWLGLYIFNLIFASTGFFIGINIASATVVGVLGVPGLLLLCILKLIYK